MDEAMGRRRGTNQDSYLLVRITPKHAGCDILYLTEWWEGAGAHSRSLAQDSISRPWTLHERLHVSVITQRTKLGGDNSRTHKVSRGSMCVCHAAQLSFASLPVRLEI